MRAIFTIPSANKDFQRLLAVKPSTVSLQFHPLALALRPDRTRFEH